MPNSRLRLVVFFCACLLAAAVTACSGSSPEESGDADTSIQPDTEDAVSDSTDVDTSDLADAQDATDASDAGDMTADNGDVQDAEDTQPDLTPPDGLYQEQLVEAGIISDLYASPGGSHFFYLFREGVPGEGSWNVLGGNLGVFHGQNGQTTRYGLAESYHSGWIEKGYTYQDYFYYARDIGAIEGDTNLILATPQSVQQLAYDTAWECMRVFENGAVAWVDLVGQQTDPFGGLMKGGIHLSLPDGTRKSFDLHQGGCRTDGLSDQLGAVLSPNGRYFAFYDYSWYDPDGDPFGSSLDLILVDLQTDDTATITSLFNEPRGPMAFTEDSSQLLFLNHDDEVTAVDAASPAGDPLSFPSDTYPHLSFTVLGSNQVLFKAQDEQNNDITVLGDLTNGGEEVIRNDAAWALLGQVDGSSLAYVISDDRLALMDWTTGQLTALDAKPARSTSAGSAFQLRGDRAVYATGNFQDGYTLRTVTPDSSATTVYEDYRLFANGNFQPLVTLNATGTQAFHLVYRENDDRFDLLSTTVPGGESITMAEDVGRFAYHPDVDRMAIVRGGLGADATYEEGQGLYLLVPNNP